MDAIFNTSAPSLFLLSFLYSLRLSLSLLSLPLHLYPLSHGDMRTSGLHIPQILPLCDFLTRTFPEPLVGSTPW